MKIDLVSREFIKPTSSPLEEYFKLSYLDQLIPPSYVPLILYYTYDDQHSSNLTQSDMSHRLKHSLAITLTQFYPLAGRMTKDQLSVDCSTDQGVGYTEARVDSRLSEIIHSPQIELLDQFLPHKLCGTGIVKVEEQLAIQVTMFQCGGMVIGICINHRIADICTLGTFIKSWAAAAKAKATTNYLVPPPSFESASLFPQVIMDSSPKSTHKSAPVERTVTKRFVFTASAIDALKAKVSNSLENPTRVEVVSAFLWKCGIVAKTSERRAVAALQVVNLRGRMVPPLREHSFGNIFQMTSAVTVTDGEEGRDLGCLAAKFRGAIGTMDGEYIMKLVGENGFEIVKSKYTEIGKMMYNGDHELLIFSSWCRFGNIYEADFGWGKPSWVSRGSSARKNCVYLMDSIREDGGIEAWVVMNELDMVRFEQDSELHTLISSFPSSPLNSI